MIVGGTWQRDHDRRLAGRRRFGTGRGPRTADDQVRLVKCLDHIRDIWPDVRFAPAILRISLTHHVVTLLSGLVRDLEIWAVTIRDTCKCIDHRFVYRSGTLRTAKYQQIYRLGYR